MSYLEFLHSIVLILQHVILHFKLTSQVVDSEVPRISLAAYENYNPGQK